MSASARSGGGQWAGWAAALAICVAANCALLRRSLFTDTVRCPADLVGALQPFAGATPGPHVPRNRQLMDWPLVFQPWDELVCRAWRAGHWPLWNSYAGCGMPLFANAQSRALSPCTALAVELGDQAGDWIQFAQMLVAEVGMLVLAAGVALAAVAVFPFIVYAEESAVVQLRTAAPCIDRRRPTRRGQQ